MKNSTRKKRTKVPKRSRKGGGILIPVSIKSEFVKKSWDTMSVSMQRMLANLITELQKDPAKLATFNRISDRESFKRYLTTANITLRDELGSYKFSGRYFDLNFNPRGAIAKKISNQMVAEAHRLGEKQSRELKKQLASQDAAMKRGADRMGRVTGDLNRRFDSQVTSPGRVPQAATFSVAAAAPGSDDEWEEVSGIGEKLDFVKRESFIKEMVDHVFDQNPQLKVTNAEKKQIVNEMLLQPDGVVKPNRVLEILKKIRPSMLSKIRGKFGKGGRKTRHGKKRRRKTRKKRKTRRR
jgi:hypothetical protein